MIDTTILNAKTEIKIGKLDAFRMYLKVSDEELDRLLNNAFSEAVEKLYAKTVPQAVQLYLATINGEIKEKKPRAKKSKPKLVPTESDPQPEPSGNPYMS